VAALFTKFDPRAFLDGERNASAAAAGEEPTLATLAGLAGRKTHSEKSEKDTVFITDVPGPNARAEAPAAKAAKAAKPAKIEPLFELLPPANGGWIAEDWRTRFAERASAAEHHRGILHAEAALWAFETVVIEWLNANPSPSAAGRCTWCGKSETLGAVVLPFGTEMGTHAWLHAECWLAWHQARRADAIAALRAMGIQA
jgi:hypothetical protein